MERSTWSVVGGVERVADKSVLRGRRPSST
jgi:hypothetical protein